MDNDKYALIDGAIIDTVDNKELTVEDIIVRLNYETRMHNKWREECLSTREEIEILRIYKESNGNNCPNCHHYNSLINWEEGVFHQCLRGNNLWELCEDYDAID